MPNIPVQEADFQVNQRMQNALDQANARHEDQLKKLEKKLTEQFDKKIEEQQKHHTLILKDVSQFAHW